MIELPTAFAGFEILAREPFERSIELTIDSAAADTTHERAFPTFVHNMDFLFEIQRIGIQLVGLTHQEQILDPQPTVLAHLVSVSFLDMSKNRIVSDHLGTNFDKNNYGIWTAPKPLFALRGETYEMKAKARHFNVERFPTLQKLRIKLTFLGNHIHLARPR
jgi:hypothetical protein